MALRPEYRAFIVELFALFGPVVVRPMFGAAGIFADGVMFGVVSGERIYLKTDTASRAAYEAEGSKPFTFVMKAGETIVTAYFELPERLYDEPDELADWARRAQEVARSSPAAKKKQRKRK